jgi:multiple sugar transport system substrate-binding protein
VPGIGAALPEFDKALTLAMTGGQDPATLLGGAAGRGTQSLEANRKKDGGGP